MAEPAVPAVPATDGGQSVLAAGAAALLASLREQGGQRFDAAGWHYLETLARRAQAHEGTVLYLLEARLAQAAAAFAARLAAARVAADELLGAACLQHPPAAAELQRLFADNDFQGLQRLRARLEARAHCAGLAALVAQLDPALAPASAPGSASSPASASAPATSPGPSPSLRPAPAPDAAPGPATGGAASEPPVRSPAARAGASGAPSLELKTVRESRATWARMSVDRQLALAMQLAPKNAGPINSHMLVLRSLALMQDISPDYFGRMVSYADTLLSLDPGQPPVAPKVKKAAPAKGAASKKGPPRTSKK